MTTFLLIIFGFLVNFGESARPTCTPSVSNQETVNVEETEPVTTIVFTYNGYDKDGHTYRFIDIDKTSSFSLPSSGPGEVAVAESLDFEKTTQYILDNVYVVHLGLNPTQFGNKCGTLTVNVLPVNEFTPVFEPSIQKVTLPENTPQNQSVATLNCTDEDKEPVWNPDGCSQLSIQSGDDADRKFTIINDQIVTTTNRIDYDTGDVIYTLIIIGVDYSTRDPRKTGTTTITVNIGPVNEFTPFILGQPLKISIPENTLVGSKIFKVNATDDDAGPHGEVTYKIIGGGVVKAMTDLLHPKYIIKVNGRDNGDPQLWSRDPAFVRIDKFDPDRTVITFYLGLLLSDYLNKEMDLLDQVEKALNEVYPTAYVRRWCIEEKETSLLVHLYAVKNDETNDVANLEKEKVFVTNGEFLDVLQLDQNKRPTIDVDGKRWGDYAVIKASQYGTDIVYPEPAISSLTDSSSELVLPLGVSLPLLALVAIATMIVLYFAWRRRWCQKKESNSKTKVTDKNGKRSLEKENSLVSNDDSSINPLTRQISGPFIPTFSDKPQETWSTKEHENWSKRESSPVNRKSNQPIGTMTPPDGSSNSNTEQNEHGKKKLGIETVTGWMFEEDPVTKVKNWIR